MNKGIDGVQSGSVRFRSKLRGVVRRINKRMEAVEHKTLWSIVVSHREFGNWQCGSVVSYYNYV